MVAIMFGQVGLGAFALGSGVIGCGFTSMAGLHMVEGDGQERKPPLLRFRGSLLQGVGRVGVEVVQVVRQVNVVGVEVEAIPCLGPWIATEQRVRFSPRRRGGWGRAAA